MATINGTDGPDQWLNGTSSDDQINGLRGEDWIRGFDGNDVIDGGPGADYMAGGQADDTYWVDDPGDRVDEQYAYFFVPADGHDTVYALINYYVLPDGVE